MDARLDKIDEKLDLVLRELADQKKSIGNTRMKVNKTLTELSGVRTIVEDNRSLSENKDIISFQKFIDLYKLDLPFKEIENFLEFENHLKDENSNMSNDLVST